MVATLAAQLAPLIGLGTFILSSLFHLSFVPLFLSLSFSADYPSNHDLIDEQTVSEQILPHLESIKSQNEIKNYLQVRSTLSLSLPLLAIQS